MSNKNTNSVFVAGVPKWVKVRETKSGTVTQFSLNHVDKKENKHYFDVSMWNLPEEKIQILKNTTDVILVKAAMRYEEYENKEGVKVRKISLVGFDFDTELQPAPKPSMSKASVPSKPAEMMDNDNDPFGDSDEDPFA